MFNLSIDSKLRDCDLVSLRVRDVTHGIRLTYIDEAGSAIADEGKRRSSDGFLPVSKVGGRQLRNDFARRDLVAEVIRIEAIEASGSILTLGIH